VNAAPASSVVSRPRRPRRRWVSALCWAGSIGLGILSLAWLLEGADWVIDLVANLNAQWLALGTAWCVVCLGLRRRGALLLGLAACGLLLLPLLLDRAAIWPRAAALPRDVLPSDNPGVPVRVLHYNARSVGSLEEHLELMTRTNADVISLLGPGVKEQSSVIYARGLEDRFAGKMTRGWKPSADGSATLISAAYVVSRWTIEPIDVSFLGEIGEHLIAGKVLRPGAPFGIIAVHPRSPRTRQRWIEGNLTVDATAEVVRRMRAAGLPVVVIADLNSTPSGARCRELCTKAGLNRGKPLLMPVGTYPEEWPLTADLRGPSMRAVWPTTLAIDDVWIDPHIRVIGWSRLGPVHSEHRPIVVDVVIPKGGAADK
jgi:hypothetical protein